MARIVDFHNHLMPAVDDGAQSIEESLGALGAFLSDGVQTIITTPHMRAVLTTVPDMLEERLAELDRAWAQVSAEARRAYPDLIFERGVELALDTPEPDVSDPRLRLAGGPFLLMEFPLMTVPPRSGAAVGALRSKGVFPIIAHPERYHGFPSDLSLAAEWRQNGAYLQVNGASLLGKYGQRAKDLAFALLERGWADYLGSDYHARGRPNIRAYCDAIAQFGGEEQVQLLTVTNPARVLDGEPPLPVAPLRMKRSLRDRLIKIFRSS